MAYVFTYSTCPSKDLLSRSHVQRRASSPSSFPFPRYATLSLSSKDHMKRSSVTALNQDSIKRCTISISGHLLSIFHRGGGVEVKPVSFTCYFRRVVVWVVEESGLCVSYPTSSHQLVGPWSQHEQSLNPFNSHQFNSIFPNLTQDGLKRCNWSRINFQGPDPSCTFRLHSTLVAPDDLRTWSLKRTAEQKAGGEVVIDNDNLIQKTLTTRGPNVVFFSSIEGQCELIWVVLKSIESLIWRVKKKEQNGPEITKWKFEWKEHVSRSCAFLPVVVWILFFFPDHNKASRESAWC